MAEATEERRVAGWLREKPGARTIVVAALAAAMVLAEMGSSALAQPPGKQDYDRYCASCHGADGKGSGKALYVIPGIKPSSLTRLSKKNGGEFPTDEVYRSIDGRAGIPSHKRFDMPFWGVRMQEQGNAFTPESEAAVKRRLSDIVSYIESIQEK